MKKDTATFCVESYDWDFSDLSRVIGEKLALGKVAQYFRKPFSENPLIQGSTLLRTFRKWAGERADAILELASISFTVPNPPDLIDEEYHDPTDKGLTYMSPDTTEKYRKVKIKAARRARRNA